MFRSLAAVANGPRRLMVLIAALCVGVSAAIGAGSAFVTAASAATVVTIPSQLVLDQYMGANGFCDQVEFAKFQAIPSATSYKITWSDLAFGGNTETMFAPPFDDNYNDGNTGGQTYPTPAGLHQKALSEIGANGGGCPALALQWTNYNGKGERFSNLVVTATTSAPDTSTVTTTATPPAAPGGNASDSAVVTGTPSGPAPTGTVVFEICYNLDTSPTGCNATTDSPTTVSTVNLSTGTSGSSGTSPTVTVNSGIHVLSRSGYYCFFASYSGDTNYDPASDTATTPECFTLSGATVTTTATHTDPPNANGSDTAVVTGTPKGPVPTGTVTFFICYNATTSPTGCSGTTDNPNTVSTVDLSTGTSRTSGTSPTVTVNSGPLAGLGRYSLPSLGFYCFFASYSGDINYDPASDTSTAAECFALTGAMVTVTAFHNPPNQPPVQDDPQHIYMNGGVDVMGTGFDASGGPITVSVNGSNDTLAAAASFKFGFDFDQYNPSRDNTGCHDNMVVSQGNYTKTFDLISPPAAFAAFALGIDSPYINGQQITTGDPICLGEILQGRLGTGGPTNIQEFLQPLVVPSTGALVLDMAANPTHGALGFIPGHSVPGGFQQDQLGNDALLGPIVAPATRITVYGQIPITAAGGLCVQYEANQYVSLGDNGADEAVDSGQTPMGPGATAMTRHGTCPPATAPTELPNRQTPIAPGSLTAEEFASGLPPHLCEATSSEPPIQSGIGNLNGGETCFENGVWYLGGLVMSNAVLYSPHAISVGLPRPRGAGLSGTGTLYSDASITIYGPINFTTQDFIAFLADGVVDLMGS